MCIVRKKKMIQGTLCDVWVVTVGGGIVIVKVAFITFQHVTSLPLLSSIFVQFFHVYMSCKAKYSKFYNVIQSSTSYKYLAIYVFGVMDVTKCRSYMELPLY